MSGCSTIFTHSKHQTQTEDPSMSRISAPGAPHILFCPRLTDGHGQPASQTRQTRVSVRDGNSCQSGCQDCILLSIPLFLLNLSDNCLSWDVFAAHFVWCGVLFLCWCTAVASEPMPDGGSVRGLRVPVGPNFAPGGVHSLDATSRK